MRFMMFMIPRVYQPDTPAEQRAGEGFAPPAAQVEKMMKFNESLSQSGTLISLDGLHPGIEGARIGFSKGKPTVIDGPQLEPKEVIGGYWMIKVKSKEEAISWAKRVPAADGDVIEIRQVYDMWEFPEHFRRAADSQGMDQRAAH